MNIRPRRSRVSENWGIALFMYGRPLSGNSTRQVPLSQKSQKSPKLAGAMVKKAGNEYS